MKLTPEQIHELKMAVAEIDGWTDIRLNLSTGAGMVDREPFFIGKKAPQRGWLRLPNYPESLDAVHGIEVAMPSPFIRYETALSKVVADDWYVGPADSKGRFASPTIATALQRCIALIQTLNPDKWQAILNMEIPV